MKKSMMATAAALVLSLTPLSHAQELSSRGVIAGMPAGKEAERPQVSDPRFANGAGSIANTSSPNGHLHGMNEHYSGRYADSAMMEAKYQRDEGGTDGRDRIGNRFDHYDKYITLVEITDKYVERRHQREVNDLNNTINQLNEKVENLQRDIQERDLREVAERKERERKDTLEICRQCKPEREDNR
ncbi:MAG: hypothetical protein Q4B88_02040 [Moraxella sp.]|nr:hypothetical protein [Moraxella sp.]